MAERCVPASTASIDPLAHLVAVDRTNSPVTLSSLGPPPEPYHATLSALIYSCGLNVCRLRLAHEASLAYVQRRDPLNGRWHEPDVHHPRHPHIDVGSGRFGQSKTHSRVDLADSHVQTRIMLQRQLTRRETKQYVGLSKTTPALALRRSDLKTLTRTITWKAGAEIEPSLRASSESLPSLFMNPSVRQRPRRPARKR